MKFSAEDYLYFLHVMKDNNMLRAMQLLMKVRLKQNRIGELKDHELTVSTYSWKETD